MTGMNRVAFRKQIPISISDVGGEAAHWKRGGCAGAQRIWRGWIIRRIFLWIIDAGKGRGTFWADFIIAFGCDIAINNNIGTYWR